MSGTRFLLGSVTALALAGRAFAQPLVEAYSPPSAPAPPDAMGLLFRLVGLLALTLVICGGILLWARRLNRVAGADATGSPRLRKKSSVALDARCAVHLVEVDGQTVAVTTDATGVRSMALLSEPMDAIEMEEPAAPVDGTLAGPVEARITG